MERMLQLGSNAWEDKLTKKGTFMGEGAVEIKRLVFGGASEDIT